MSLLLDALKRAEQEKLARGDRPDLQVVGESAATQATPAANASHAASPANASLKLQPIASPGAARPSAPATKGQQTPAQAQVVFQAKANAVGERPKRGLLYAAAASITIAILAAGGYVWYAMKSLAAPTPIARAPLPPPMAAPASGAIAAAPADGKPAPDKALANPVPPAAATATAIPTAPTATPGGPAVAPPPSTRKATTPPPTREEIVQELLRQPSARREPLRLDRTQSGVATPPADVTVGYAALRQGDLQAARRSYQSALRADPGNIDAQLGMATLEARDGRIPAAADGYRRVLELDPRNETALAGLAALADASRGGSVEAQLRQDVMRYANSAALRFALGNLLAAQGRWSEAQGEFFEAHRLDPGNADVAHNLAVSLDNLGQSRLALDFYRRALDAARSQPGQFDPAPVERRIAEMLR